MFCNIENIVCDVANSFCNVAKMIFDIKNSLCDMAKMLCDVAKTLCNCGKLVYNVENSFCKIGREKSHEKNIFPDVKKRLKNADSLNKIIIMKKEYADFFDYLVWRGDLNFEQSPFNAVDALLLSQLSYLDFSTAVPHAEASAIRMKDCARLHEEIRAQDAGLMINERTPRLFFEAAKSERFGDVLMSDFVSKHDEASEEQFCAITFTLDKDSVFVAFRGTDDTLMGWKEDFNLSFLTDIPSQKDAADYLQEQSSAPYVKRVFVGGHSKGGNLSLYAASHLKNYGEKLCAVFNFDGPGFLKETLERSEYQAIKGKTFSFYPQLSIIGQLFEHFENYAVVKSSAQFLSQHDPFTWHLAARGFEQVESLEAGSVYFHKTFNEWAVSLDSESREQFVSALFEPLLESSYKSLSEMSENWLFALGSVIHATSEMDSDIKKEARKVLQGLLSVAKGNFGVLIAKQRI